MLGIYEKTTLTLFGVAVLYGGYNLYSLTPLPVWMWFIFWIMAIIIVMTIIKVIAD